MLWCVIDVYYNFHNISCCGIFIPPCPLFLKDCTDAEKQTFSSCIQGRAGGLDPDPDLRSCKSKHYPKEDWFPAMCVQFETNAFLGEFYSNADKLTTVSETNAKLVDQQKSNVYTYR